MKASCQPSVIMLHIFLDVFLRSLGMCSSSHSTESERQPESSFHYKEQTTQQNMWSILLEHRIWEQSLSQNSTSGPHWMQDPSLTSTRAADDPFTRGVALRNHVVPHINGADKWCQRSPPLFNNGWHRSLPARCPGGIGGRSSNRHSLKMQVYAGVLSGGAAAALLRNQIVESSPPCVHSCAHDAEQHT